MGCYWGGAETQVECSPDKHPSQASPDPIVNGIVTEHLFTIFVFHLTYEFMFLCAGFKIYQIAEPPTICELQAADDVTASPLGRKGG